MNYKKKMKEKVITPIIIEACNLTMNMLERQACLWYTYQPKEPLEIKKISTEQLF